mgnify:CR=1 FL=1
MSYVQGGELELWSGGSPEYVDVRRLLSLNSGWRRRGFRGPERIMLRRGRACDWDGHATGGSWDGSFGGS